MDKDYNRKNLLPRDGELFYFSDFVVSSKCVMNSILSEVEWRNDKIVMFGKSMSQPRKVAWYGDKSISYTYSGIKMITKEWTPTLKQLQKQLEKTTGHVFNSVLVNLYRDGEDYMSWHSDDEIELGRDPVIASISMGVGRDFLFRYKSDNSLKVKCFLEDGSLLMMQGEIQTFWQHMLPKRKKVNLPRLNLTFRKIFE